MESVMLDMQLNLVHLLEVDEKKHFFGDFSYIFSSHRWWITDAALGMCVQPSSPLSSFAHPSCTSLVFILLFIKSQYTVFAHLICFCTFILLQILLFISLFYLYTVYICSCVVLLLYYFYFYSFALSTDRTWFDLHFTSDYTLYNLLCDE